MTTFRPDLSSTITSKTGLIAFDMKSVTIAAFIAVILTIGVSAQITPVVDEESAQQVRNSIKPAPISFEAKYEGGIFGFTKKEKGSLKFDDLNELIVFYGKDGKAKFSIPFRAISVVSPQSRSVTTGTGRVVSHVPLPGAGLAGLIRKKQRFLVIQFEDPEVNVRGITSFRLGGHDILESVIKTLGEKAGMTSRGDSYYRQQGQRRTGASAADVKVFDLP